MCIRDRVGVADIVVVDTPDAVLAVSYTHLDVYKRQVVDGRSTVRPTSLVGSSLHLLVIDPQPGVYGLAWTWPGEGRGDAQPAPQ